MGWGRATLNMTRLMTCHDILTNKSLLSKYNSHVSSFGVCNNEIYINYVALFVEKRTHGYMHKLQHSRTFDVTNLIVFNANLAAVYDYF